MPDRYFTKYLPDPKRPKRRAWLGWLLTFVIILSLTGIVTVWVSLNTFLESDALREIASEQISRRTNVSGRLEALKWTGNSVFSEGFAGVDGNRSLEASQVRGTVDWFSFFSEAWRVDDLEIASVDWIIGSQEARSPNLLPPPTEPEAVPFFATLAPSQLQIEQIRVREFSFEHATENYFTAIRKTTLNAVPGAGDFDLSALGGEVLFGGQKPWLLIRAHGRASGTGTLFLTEGELRHAGGGTANLTGEIGLNAQSPTRLHARLRGLDVTGFLTGQYAGNLTGRLMGEVHYSSTGGKPLHGNMALSEGRVTGLPVLQRIADFTRVPEFIAPRIHTAKGDFEKSGDRLIVKNFVMESEGLMKVEGEFTISGDEIDGNFEVGVAARTLQWVPGAENRVFQVRGNQDGYLWTPLRLTGPVENPREDLSARLVAGMGEAAVDFTINGAAAAAGAASSILETGAGVGTGVLDALLGRPPAAEPDADEDALGETPPIPGSGIFSPLFR